MGQNRYQIIGADVFLKGLIQLRIGFKIEIRYILIACAPKLQNGISLSDLSCTLQNKRFSVFILFPCFQEAHNFSVHNQTSLKVLIIV